jgi:hypothetical protein
MIELGQTGKKVAGLVALASAISGLYLKWKILEVYQDQPASSPKVFLPFFKNGGIYAPRDLGICFYVSTAIFAGCVLLMFLTGTFKRRSER